VFKLSLNHENIIHADLQYILLLGKYINSVLKFDY